MVTTDSEPVYKTGKICYVEIPAVDVEQSAHFYQHVFGWQVRRRGDGARAFDDTVHQVSGAWVTGRPPQSDPGLMVYIMVADIAEAVASVVAAGGEIVRRVDPDASEIIATFRDPAGNVLGMYQEPGLGQDERHRSAH